jgi:DNA primase
VTRYTADSRDRVRDAVDMLAVVGDRTELRRAGANEYVGRCPFHDERTPSFGVNPLDKVYHCFGCQASGDVFNFVMETEGIDFVGALETLANRFGVQLETVDEDPRAAERRERRERLQALLGRAAAYYARSLWEAREAGPAREYLLGRGLSEAILREFRVGYAPSAWDRVLTASRRAGFGEEELLAAGLVQRSKSRPGQVYDRFRQRIMFPTADARGRVIGFGARAMRAEQQPKYLNTSESELYHKRQVLYGIDRARAAGAKTGRMILVEGYTDVLAMHQAGLTNVVAIMGTSLTEEQVAELVRIVGTWEVTKPDRGVLELCLDADRAGQDAMLRAAQLAERRSLRLRVVPLPAGLDPADLIQREGPERLRDRVAESMPFVEFHVDRILERADTRSAEGKDRTIAELAPALDLDAYSGVLREELPRRIANRLELSEGQLTSLLSAAGQSHGTPRSHGSDAPPAPSIRVIDQSVRAERTFLALCIALPDLGAATLARVNSDELLTSELMRRAARHIAPRTRTPLADLPADDDELARTVADLVERAGRAGSVSPERLEHATLVLERSRLDRAIRRARATGATGGISALALEREQVLAAIHKVVAQLERAV